MLDFSILVEYLPQIANGVLWTVMLFFAAAVLSIIGGVMLALAVLYAPPACAMADPCF